MNTNIAVIGCGTIANAAHFPALSTIGGVNIKYCVDLIAERAEKAKEKYGAKEAITDYTIALEDKEVEAVFILTPNYSHYTITMDALSAGKHVFCEKPITVNYKLSKEMADFAEKQNKILNIGVCNRFNKSVELLEKMNNDGYFGDIYHVYCSFRSHRSIPGLGGDFTTKAKSGGGVLIDWGVHFFDLILYITKAKLKAVSSNCYSKLAKKMEDYTFTNMWAGPPKYDGINDVEESVSGYVRTDGANISFNGAWAQNIGESEMFIDFLGTKAGARLSYGGKFKIYTQNNGVLETITPDYDIPNMYKMEDESFFESIRTGKKNKSHIDNVLETAKLLDAVYASAQAEKELIL